MPPAARTLRRAVTNENDENATTSRLTRAKAAALDVNISEPPKKAPARRALSTNNITAGSQPARRRAALGDVSNVNKADVVESKALGKGGLAKTQKPTGITKSRTTSQRPAPLAQKANNSSSGTKRPSSGSGFSTTASKKRQVSATKIMTDDDTDETSENRAPADLDSQKVVEPVIPVERVVSEVKAEPRADVKPEIIDVDDDRHAADVGTMKDYVKDLDAEDMDDPLMVAEYVHEIFDYMRELEISTLPNANYMDLQTELEWKMRGILIDWLLEVHGRFRLLPETLFLAVNIIDRFLSCKVVQLDRLQLVGVTAMFIASKYEEVISPHVQNFRHVADDGFTEAEILSAERFILSALDYDLSYPNPMNFLRRISKADNYDIHTRTLGKYLLEIGCVDHRFLQYPPSHVAAAAMYLSREVLDRGEWDVTLAHYAGYTEEEIQPVFKLMVDYLQAPVVHDAFFRKYASKKFLKASIVLRQWAKKWAPRYLDGFELSAESGSATPTV